MTLKSRLDKLEQATAERERLRWQAAKVKSAISLRIMRPPTGVPEEVWQRAVTLLGSYSPALLDPWRSLDQVADWCQEHQIDKLEDLPDPLLDSVDAPRLKPKQANCRRIG